MEEEEISPPFDSVLHPPLLRGAKFHTRARPAINHITSSGIEDPSPRRAMSDQAVGLVGAHRVGTPSHTHTTPSCLQVEEEDERKKKESGRAHENGAA